MNPRSSKNIKKIKTPANPVPLANSVRIIGGKFRGRKLAVLSANGLRPSSDRVRETLFNWLMNDLIDINCLDAFAGTGALGFEALSRGAKKIIFLENNPEIVKALKETAQLFKSEPETEIKLIDALSYLNHPANKTFDLVFCDPPFKQNLLSKTLELLINNQWVKPGSLIYIEHEQGLEITDNNNFEVIKQKHTEQVVYGLLRVKN